MVVTKVGRFYGRSSRTYIGVTQRYPVSPIVSDVLVDAVVRAVLPEVCGLQILHHGFGWVAREHSIVLYLYNGCIVGRNPIRV